MGSTLYVLLNHVRLYTVYKRPQRSDYSSLLALPRSSTSHCFAKLYTSIGTVELVCLMSLQTHLSSGKEPSVYT